MILKKERKSKQIFSLRNEIKRRKFESDNSDIFESLNFEDLKNVKLKESKEKISGGSNFNDFLRKDTLEVDF